MLIEPQKLAFYLIGLSRLSNIDNVTYTFIDSIYDSIIVKRDNIVIDGNGFMPNCTECCGMDWTYPAEAVDC